MIEARREPRISQESVDSLYDRRNDLSTRRSRMVERWKQVAEQFAPSMTNWDDTSPEIEPPEVKDLHDNTGYKASLLLTDGVQGYSFSRRDPWFRNTVDDEDLMATEPVAEWLQAFERHQYRQFARSNFYDEGRIFTKCASDFGTAVMLAREDLARGVTNYEALHLKNALIDDDPFGYPVVLFHTIWLRADIAAKRWGYDRLPIQLQQAVDSKSRVLFKFDHVIMPMSQYDLDISMRESRGHPIYSIIMSDADRYHPVNEGGFDVSPFFAWRWSRDLEGSPYGTDSPGLIEVSNARQVNGMAGDYARLVEQLARPAIKATEGLVGKINIKPNGVTYLPYGEDFTTSMVAGNPQFVGELIESIRNGIKESYHVDFFLILTQAIQQQKTATEVAGVQGEKAALMASFFGRMASEFLEPIHEYSVNAEIKSGRFAMPTPKELVGKDMQPTLVSPLALMQKRFLTLEPTKQALAEILPLAQIRPEILDNLDLDRYARFTGEEYNMDRRIMFDIATVQNTRKARAELAAEERKMAAQQQMMETAKTGAEAQEASANAKAMTTGGV